MIVGVRSSVTIMREGDNIDKQWSGKGVSGGDLQSTTKDDSTLTELFRIITTFGRGKQRHYQNTDCGTIACGT